MQIDLSGQHVEITQAIKAHVEDKFNKLERHHSPISNVHVVLKVENSLHTAEATLHVNHQDIFANDTQNDMYWAIDNLAAKLDRQLVKHKEKSSRHR